jgi:CubicO group peptidase (beta-lactamase class C family)
MSTQSKAWVGLLLATCFGVLVVVWWMANAAADVSAETNAATVGVSPERLGRLDRVMQQYVDEGRIGGMVTLIARQGQIVHLKAYGNADVEQRRPMKPDTIFRMASTTKIVTTVAVLQLMEEGRLLVTDPVSKYLPGFKNTQVAVLPAPGSKPAAPFTLAPSKREITIHDVLTKTSGIAYPQGPTRPLYEAEGFHQWYFADKAEPMCVWMEKLPKLPFHAQPGEQWFNGYTSDILGCVVEKVTGMTLDEFFRTRIFEPLGMTDTHFFLPREKVSRLAVVYTPSASGEIARADGPWGAGQGDYVDGPQKAFSGGAGLLSTASDYGRFLQMLLNQGELDGARVLSPRTVAAITQNHVGTLYRRGELGFGYNVEVVLEEGHGDRLGAAGSFGWQGAYFPRFWVDPVEGLVAVFLAQLSPYGGASDLHQKFDTLVYQAIVQSTMNRQTLKGHEQ